MPGPEEKVIFLDSPKLEGLAPSIRCSFVFKCIGYTYMVCNMNINICLYHYITLYMIIDIILYIPRESHVYSLPWILCKSYSLPRPRRPRADHADHALTPFRPSLCCQHRSTVLALTPKQDLNRFPTCKITKVRLDSYNLIHVAIMTSSVIATRSAQE